MVINMAEIIEKVSESCQLLKELGSVGEPQSLSELCKLMKTTKSSMKRMLDTLVMHGFVDKSGDCYSLGSGVATLWASYRNGKKKLVAEVQKDLKETEVNPGGMGFQECEYEVVVN